MQIINVMAASVDGKIAAHALESDQDRRKYGFSSSEDQEFVRQQITAADAVITGANSMRASRGAWNQRGRGGRYPLWVVLSNTGLAPELNFWQQSEIPRWLVSAKPLTLPVGNNGVVNLTYGNENPAQFIVRKLQEHGAERALLFGGSEVNYLFYDAKLVNELKLTVCPLILGAEAAPALVQAKLSEQVPMTLVASQTAGDHVFLSYRILNNR